MSTLAENRARSGSIYLENKVAVVTGGTGVLGTASPRCRDKIMEKFGRIDVLVNGAGGNQKGATVSPDGSFFEVPRAAIEGVFELNITGTMLPTQIFGEVMARQGSGSIINVSSISSTSR
ncbi:hypothetical protein JL720_15979 [Aureococcus anophagefferens]|nr:hypothetical protein JL720_15979 [Aureococcus anophagefferens]